MILAALTVALAVLAVWVPLLAAPAFGAWVLEAVLGAGRTRVAALVLAAPFVAVGLYRFSVRVAMPNLVSSGRRTAEEAAVSRLREIRWAEERARELGRADRDHDGQGEYALMGELVGGEGPLSDRLFLPLPAPADAGPAATGLYEREGFAFTVSLPGRGGAATREAARVDPREAGRRFRAFAWPLDGGRDRRLFSIDEEERVCEADNAPGFGGADRVPPPEAAPAPGCGPAGGVGWRPWRKGVAR